MHTKSGFSLVEVLVATAMTVGLGAAVCGLLYQDGRIFRDQALILEMQQTARLATAAIADDIRMAGQAIPAKLPDIVLPGSGTSRLNVRAGYSATETAVVSSLPLSLTVGIPIEVAVESPAGFAVGRQVFLWNVDGWARATIDSVSVSSSTIRMTPSEASADAFEFVIPPALSLDEAVAIFLDPSSGSIRRTTATNTSNLQTPSWAPANELASNVISLTFVYYDKSGMVLDPGAEGFPSLITAVEARVAVRSSEKLSNGTQATFAVAVRSLCRNLWLRQAVL